MTKFESVCILLEEKEQETLISNITQIERIREYNSKLEAFWNEKEKSMMEHCSRNKDCYPIAELCYAQPLMQLANKLGSKLVSMITKKLSDEELIQYHNEIEALTNGWVTRKSKYSGLYHGVEHKDPTSDKTFHFAQAQGGLVGGNPMMTSNV